MRRTADYFEVPTINGFWKWHRKRKKFLLFPKTIGKETRWWETAEWEEVWQDNPFLAPSDDLSVPYDSWMAIKWLNPTSEFIKTVS
jgi:hypothetical protein